MQTTGQIDMFGNNEENSPLMPPANSPVDLGINKDGKKKSKGKKQKEVKQNQQKEQIDSPSPISTPDLSPIPDPTPSLSPRLTPDTVNLYLFYVSPDLQVLTRPSLTSTNTLPDYLFERTPLNAPPGQGAITFRLFTPIYYYWILNEMNRLEKLMHEKIIKREVFDVFNLRFQKIKGIAKWKFGNKIATDISFLQAQIKSELFDKYGVYKTENFPPLEDSMVRTISDFYTSFKFNPPTPELLNQAFNWWMRSIIKVYYPEYCTINNQVWTCVAFHYFFNATNRYIYLLKKEEKRDEEFLTSLESQVYDFFEQKFEMTWEGVK